MYLGLISSNFSVRLLDSRWIPGAGYTMSKSFIESTLVEQDLPFEIPLRPQSLDDFIGQDAIRERLDVLIGAAKQRGEYLGHCLFSGPPGLGKTTLANILAKAMGTNLVVTSGPVIEKAGDLAGILTSLKVGDVLFIDEIHRLSRVVEEYLYQAMEDFSLDLMIDSGPNARSIQVKLNSFTLAGATTRLGLLSEPLRSRFAFTCRLDYYDPLTLEKVILRTARILNLNLNGDAALEIARRSRGTPRIANHLLRWVRDFAQMRTNNLIDREVVDKALRMLSIDERGLDEMDKKILEAMIDHYQGGPVGLNAIAASIGEEPNTIEEVYEPYLIMQGLLKRTPRGREVTTLGYQHLGRDASARHDLEA
jgi:Holliday junction DNA helicase RuvB